MINYYQSNFNDIEFRNTKISRTQIAELIKTSRDNFDTLYNKYFHLLKENRNKIAAHQDSINYNNVSSIGDYVFPLQDMLNLLPELEKLFAALYYSLTDEEYIIYPEKSFIDEGLHVLYEDKMNEIENK